jgi:hypothetical protein
MINMNPLRYGILMAISLVAVAYLIPVGLQAIASANMTGVNSAVSSIFTVVLPILVILGLALAFMPQELKDKVGL